jgi:hypothetical protein
MPQAAASILQLERIFITLTKAFGRGRDRPARLALGGQAVA